MRGTQSAAPDSWRSPAFRTKGNNEIISRFGYYKIEALCLYRRGGKASRLPSRDVNDCPSLPSK